MQLLLALMSEGNGILTKFPRNQVTKVTGNKKMLVLKISDYGLLIGNMFPTRIPSSLSAVRSFFQRRESANTGDADG